MGMETIKLGPLKSWSFSKAIIFEECPYRAKLSWVDKVPNLQPQTQADRGTRIHQEAEDYVKGKGDFTTNLRHFEPDFKALKNHYAAGRVLCEEEWGFDIQWNFLDDWRRAWLRLKADAVCFLNARRAVVIDYKTGKRFGNELKHARQLQLYALCTLIIYQDLQEVTCEIWYLDQNELASFTMKRRQVAKYLRIFDRLGRDVTTETKFEPRPNVFSCQYCPYSPAKQGDCKFGVQATQFKLKEQTIDLSKLKPSSDDLSEFKGRV